MNHISRSVDKLSDRTLRIPRKKNIFKGKEIRLMSHYIISLISLIINN